MSENYYENHGQDFARDTASVDLEALYSPFLKLIPKNGLILDAGCGSGRDTNAFSQRGYSVVAIDSSPQMCKIATEYTGQEVLLCRFQDLNYTDYFDGIWACASLLHVTKLEISSVLKLLSKAMKEAAPMYMSFKEGTEERTIGGRYFCDYTAESLAEELSHNTDLQVLRIWVTNDARPGRNQETWVNALCCKI